jgi:Fuc2NAc and GlcNAc transferase
MSIDALVGLAAVFAASWLLTAGICRLAVARGVLDVPGSRSSHSRPTPRGGGLAIVATVLSAVAVMALLGAMPRPLAAVLFFGGLPVGLVGLADDVRSTPVGLRLIVQFAACAWCVWLLGPLPPLPLGSAAKDLGLAGTVFSVFCLVWLLNLYNFMDGIDGIAGVEAVSVMICAAALLGLSSGLSPPIIVFLLISASVLGFLAWNWPLAKIFMGDSGSGFLGFCLGSIAWSSVVERRLSAWVWFILMGVFIVDATVTLVRRWHRGARVTDAHRSHAYQRLSRKYGSHKRVTIGVLCINLFWLDPLAYAAVRRPALGAMLAAIAWLPLVLLAYTSGAGLDDER